MCRPVARVGKRERRDVLGSTSNPLRSPPTSVPLSLTPILLHGRRSYSSPSVPYPQYRRAEYPWVVGDRSPREARRQRRGGLREGAHGSRALLRAWNSGGNCTAAAS